MYKIIQNERNRKVFDIVHDDWLVFQIKGVNQDFNTLIHYETTNQYLPIEYLHTFIAQIVPPPHMLAREWKVKDHFVEIEMVCEIPLNEFIQLFN